jgi:glycosyltransferase involved in cell wall biosynthesis
MTESKNGISILICHVEGRESFLNRLLERINESIKESPFPEDFFEVLISDNSKEKTIGTKRNELLANATKKYLCFIDDDDLVSFDYAATLGNATKSDKDCISLIGEISIDGAKPKLFYHSVKYTMAFETDKSYFRPPNHLNCIKSEIAKNFSFKEINHGEDMDWAMQMVNSKALKSEFEIQYPIYFYEYVSKK